MSNDNKAQDNDEVTGEEGAPATTVREKARTVSSLGEYLGIINELHSRWCLVEGALLWFRGHSEHDWVLDPSLLREAWTKADEEPAADLHEEALSAEFRRRGSAFARLPEDSLERLVVMRHHGFPTRLLDWTESSLAALYFAVRAFRNTATAAVWVLEPASLLIRLARERGEELSHSTEYLYAQELAHPTFASDASRVIPSPFSPIESEPRVAAQRGCFTIHTHALGALERLADEPTNPVPLMMLRIPHKSKRQLLKELRWAGVSEATLFPDLDGLARDLQMALGRCVYDK